MIFITGEFIYYPYFIIRDGIFKMSDLRKLLMLRLHFVEKKFRYGLLL